jgi:hypothetical protein
MKKTALLNGRLGIRRRFGDLVFNDSFTGLRFALLNCSDK